VKAVSGSLSYRNDTGQVAESRHVPALDIISEMTASLASENDLEAVLERFLDPIVRLAGADAGAVRMVTEDNLSMRLVGSLGLPANVVRHEQLVESRCGVCGNAVREDTIGWATDLRTCSQRTAGDFFGQSCKRVLAVPLHYKGRVLGIYNLFLSADRDISPEVSSLLRAIGDLLGLALENARLTRENLRATVMHERQMMANEVHDSLAQTMSYVKMRLPLLQQSVLAHDEATSLKYLSDINQGVSTAYSSLREILTHFRKRMDPQGLMHALQATADNFHDKTGIRLDFVNLTSGMEISVEQEVQVYHIVQEALANVAKHSLARQARLTLDRKQGGYEISIEDDGTGRSIREPSQAETGQDEPAHFGLDIMRERAQHLGGQIEIESRAGAGTRVRLSFPIANPGNRTPS
jgi:two-component system nitrate/nitrite sensor histidine kinase NarX